MSLKLLLWLNLYMNNAVGTKFTYERPIDLSSGNE
jgi:hypothetical protein